jgi:hypothetical protein
MHRTKQIESPGPEFLLRRTGPAAFVLVLWAAALFGACKSSVSSQGKQGEVTAAYSFGRLDAQLPANVTVLSAHAAAKGVLKSRGLTIVEESATRDRSRVSAKSPADGVWDATVVESWTAGGGGAGGPWVRVDVGMGGNEASARSILDAILARLGR